MIVPFQGILCSVEKWSAGKPICMTEGKEDNRPIKVSSSFITPLVKGLASKPLFASPELDGHLPRLEVGRFTAVGKVGQSIWVWGEVNLTKLPRHHSCRLGLSFDLDQVQVTFAPEGYIIHDARVLGATVIYQHLCAYKTDCEFTYKEPNLCGTTPKPEPKSPTLTLSTAVSLMNKTEPKLPENVTDAIRSAVGLPPSSW